MSLHSLSPDTVELREKNFLLPTYARTAFHPRTGKGAKLVDADGKEYWDLLAGIAVNALGYDHPSLQWAIGTYGSEILHVSNLFYHPAQGLLAERLVELSGLSRAFFCNSGTEANEAALKLSRLKSPGRSHVVALEESFHGRTMGSLSLTGHAEYREPFEPLIPGTTFVPPNDIEALRLAVTTNTAAIFLEPVMGEGGVIPLTVEYLQAASAIARAAGALLILDEIQCGLGRTGRMFAFQHAGILPDVVTLAKPLGGGLPLGCVLVGPALEGVIRPGHHGTTFGGNPLACRLGLTFLATIDDENLLQKVTLDGEWIAVLFGKLMARHPTIIDVRGSGLMWGIELDEPAAPIAKQLLEKGFVVGTARQNVLRLLPPYVIPRKAITAFVATLEEILCEIEASRMKTAVNQ